MFAKRIVLTAFIGVLAAMLIVATMPRSLARAQSQNSLGENPIVGSWHVTVHFDDGRPDEHVLWTFNRDRTFTMGGSWPGRFGPGHGAWEQRQGDDGFSIDLTFFRLLYKASETNETTGALSATFDGTLKGQNKLTVSDDAQSFTGRYAATRFDVAGNVLRTFTGGVDATRVVVEPLP